MKLKAGPRGGVEGLGPAPAVILCRPQMGENVGTAARAMLNFGLTDLRLVAPRFGWPNAKAVAASSGAHEILNRMTIHGSLAEAAADRHHLYATTARPREMVKPVVDARGMAAEARRQIGEGRGVGVVFGPERTGLSNDEITLADAVLTIPLNPHFSSLNLAQAVLLCGYEWFLSAGAAPPPAGPAEEAEPPATKAELARLLDHLFAELDAVGYFRSESRRESLARTIGLMLERRQLTQPEIHLLHGIIKELRRGPLGNRGPRNDPAPPSSS